MSGGSGLTQAPCQTFIGKASQCLHCFFGFSKCATIGCEFGKLFSQTHAGQIPIMGVRHWGSDLHVGLREEPFKVVPRVGGYFFAKIVWIVQMVVSVGQNRMAQELVAGAGHVHPFELAFKASDKFGVHDEDGEDHGLAQMLGSGIVL